MFETHPCRWSKRPTACLSCLVGPAAPGSLTRDQASRAVGAKKLLRACFTSCYHKLNSDMWREPFSGWLWELVGWSLNPSGSWIILGYHFQTKYKLRIHFLIELNHWFSTDGAPGPIIMSHQVKKKKFLHYLFISLCIVLIEIYLFIASKLLLVWIQRWFIYSLKLSCITLSLLSPQGSIRHVAVLPLLRLTNDKSFYSQQEILAVWQFFILTDRNSVGENNFVPSQLPTWPEGRHHSRREGRSCNFLPVLIKLTSMSY